MKAFRIFLLILIIIGLVLIFTRKYWVPKLVNQILIWEGGETYKAVVSEEEKDVVPKITITSKDIKEENFSGKVSVISGSSLVAKKSREYITAEVAEFRKMANGDVPGIREKFGADNPTANYEIEINAEYRKGPKTESIVMQHYVFTGGAHGNTRYKVVTTNIPGTKVLSLSNIITEDKKGAFTAYIKKELMDWRPEGSTGVIVFEEEVQDLTFASFKDWSMDEDSLTIYFDQYEIGPGVLGAVAFPISLSSIQVFLQSF